MFEQTATALVTAIDAKDVYSHGHSICVAEYSERIARMMGKGDEECLANREEKFRDWNAWKAGNKEGYDCAVLFTRDRNRITVSTANLGLVISDRLICRMWKSGICVRVRSA